MSDTLHNNPEEMMSWFMFGMYDFNTANVIKYSHKTISLQFPA